MGGYGCVIIERTGTDVYGFLLSHDVLYEHRVSKIDLCVFMHLIIYKYNFQIEKCCYN